MQGIGFMVNRSVDTLELWTLGPWDPGISAPATPSSLSSVRCAELDSERILNRGPCLRAVLFCGFGVSLIQFAELKKATSQRSLGA